MEPIKKTADRRNKQRFALQREVRYKMAEDGVVVSAGNGQTIDIGSGGVAFSCEGRLLPGAFVELSISWPVLLDETCPMRLIVFGRVLRSQNGQAVCSVDKYEFRTQAKATVQTMPAPRADSMLQRWADGVRRTGLKANMLRA
jgi:hypothetical protein